MSGLPNLYVMAGALPKPKRKGPSKRWQNWYRLLADERRHMGKPVRRGAIVVSKFTWPSKEIAEEKARESYSLDGTKFEETWAHVGAFPAENTFGIRALR